MVLGAEVVLPFVQKLFCHAYSHAHPRPFHARGEGGEFDVAEDTPRVQENIHAKFHGNRFIGVAVHREHTGTHTSSFIYIYVDLREFNTTNRINDWFPEISGTPPNDRYHERGA